MFRNFIVLGAVAYCSLVTAASSAWAENITVTMTPILVKGAGVACGVPSQFSLSYLSTGRAVRLNAKKQSLRRRGAQFTSYRFDPATGFGHKVTATFNAMQKKITVRELALSLKTKAFCEYQYISKMRA
jgi:hypothetical protein